MLWSSSDPTGCFSVTESSSSSRTGLDPVTSNIVTFITASRAWAWSVRGPPGQPWSRDPSIPRVLTYLLGVLRNLRDLQIVILARLTWIYDLLGLSSWRHPCITRVLSRESRKNDISCVQRSKFFPYKWTFTMFLFLHGVLRRTEKWRCECKIIVEECSLIVNKIIITIA